MSDWNPLPAPHPATISIEQLWEDCEFSATRGSGPGGQHRNKSFTGVALKHVPTGVVAEATERRSQAMNRREAIFRLRCKLALRIRCIPEPAALRELGATYGGPRLRMNPDNERYPELLARVLDQIAASRAELNIAAEMLGTTTSQMVRFLKLEPDALLLVNQWRHAAGRHPLK